MRVSELGEFGLIEVLCRELGIPYPPSGKEKPRAGLLVDIGDDALVTQPDGDAVIWTTDTLVAGVHFLPERTPWRNTGWKAIAVNVSDIAAMGGAPELALVTLCLPQEFCVEDAVELYRGIKDCCEAYGVLMGGGDIVRSPFFAVTVALSGVATRDAAGETLVLTRGAARPGDALAVTGTLGDSAAGVLLLASSAGRSDDSTRALIEALERPRPQVDTAHKAVAAGVRCGMDVSDGLLQDAGHIARASGVHIRVDAAKLPLSAELRAVFPERALELALTGGEDYQLLLCAPAGTIDRLHREGVAVTVIGEVLEGDAQVSVEGIERPDQARTLVGWDHFRSGTT